jgi:very-short-patch-repair endonuclease
LALRNSTRCLTAEGFVVVLDSILNLRLMTRAGLMEAMAPLPGWQRKLLERCDRSEAGTESMVRLRLRALGVKVRSQVSIPEVGRVDLLVGDCLVIEVDSREHHTKSSAYEADRERDRRLTARGYRVVRLSYHQIVHDWARVELDLLGMVRQGLQRARAARGPELLGPERASPRYRASASAQDREVSRDPTSGRAG